MITHKIKWFFIKLRHKFFIKLAFMMPHRLVMWCFIRVHGESGEGPGEDYCKASDYYCNKYKIKDL